MYSRAAYIEAKRNVYYRLLRLSVSETRIMLQTSRLHKLLCALTGLQVFRQCRDEDRDQEVFMIDRCPADHIIYIGSATAGYSWSITWRENSSQCRVGGNSQCKLITYHQQIMRCNGRRNCNFGRDVFNQTCYGRQVNFIDIRYNCIDGKSIYFMIRLFATTYSICCGFVRDLLWTCCTAF